MVDRLDVVTGAFSYSGSAIAAELHRRGRRVRTLTNHPGDSPDVDEVSALDLTDPAGLRRSLDGVDTLYNTYWVRFPHRDVTFDSAVAGSRAMFAAARDAGVGRIVHVSITHADPASPYPYFRGKAEVEQALAETGVSSAVVRPAILFGGDGVLINNIAWLVRRSPLVLIGGDGRYRIRGIHVDDLATLMADLGAGDEHVTLDAVGPESISFTELLTEIRTAVGSRALVAHVPGAVFPVVTGVLGAALRDTLLTRDEYAAMAAGLADSDAPATGTTRITEWIHRHADELGRTYANELHRHFRARATTQPQ